MGHDGLMVYDKIMLGGCLVLLVAAHASQVVSRKRGDWRQARALHLVRLGLSLSALSYLLRFAGAPRAGHPSALVSLLGSSGTMLLWLGWLGHWRARAGRPAAHPATRAEGDEPLPEQAPQSPASLSRFPLTARTRQAIHHAQDEARRRHESCVDTDHLLLGLLRDPGSAGVHLLDSVGAGPEKAHLELLAQMAPRRKVVPPRRTGSGPPALTDRADQVFAQAAQEAHRFESPLIGTEHLLLGLVLAGKGEAAAALFAEGVTVDALRAEIMRAKKDARAGKEGGGQQAHEHRR